MLNQFGNVGVEGGCNQGGKDPAEGAKSLQEVTDHQADPGILF